MKKYIKNIHLHTLLAALLMLSVAACKKASFDDYSETDIAFPQPTITQISPATAEIGTEVTITGTNLEKTLRLIVGANSREATITSKSDTEIKFKVPRTANSGKIRLETAFKKFAEIGPLTVTYPVTTITSWPSKIERTQSFKLKGENIDLLTSCTINGQRLVVDGSSGTLTEISISTLGLTLPDNVTLVLEALGGVNPAVSPSISVTDYDPTTQFDPEPAVVFWDFEDGVNPFNTGDITPANGINAAGIIKGRGQNYLSIKYDNITDPWGTNVGNMISPELTLSGFHKPHLTFMVNTNGKQGYFQLHVAYNGKKGGGHFTAATSSNANDNYTFQTNGWEWRSIDLSAFAFEDWFGTGKPDFSTGDGPISVEFFLKQGNGTNPFEISLDQVMITDGKYDPRAQLFDFENGVVDFQSNTGAATGINTANVPTIVGDKYFSVQKQVVSNWDWTGAIQAVGPFNMSGYQSPFLNIWVNTGSGRGYFQVETTQDGTKWGIGQTAPDYLFSTNGQWQLVSIDLKKAGWGNWGGSGTEINWDGVLDYISLGFSTGNVGGATMEDFQISVDDISISNGPLF